MAPRGIYELKYFFGSHVATEDRRRAPRPRSALIKQLVGPRTKKPLSDSKISARSSASRASSSPAAPSPKYREVDAHPPVNLRKSL
jgi:RNA polymerase sigma-54 factor